METEAAWIARIAWEWLLWAFVEGMMFGAFFTLCAQSITRVVSRRRARRGACAS